MGDDFINISPLGTNGNIEPDIGKLRQERYLNHAHLPLAGAEYRSSSQNYLMGNDLNQESNLRGSLILTKVRYDEHQRC